MSDVINNTLAPDNAPTAASTLDNTAPHSRAIVDVSNAAIFWQAKVGAQRATATWDPPAGVFMVPGSRRAPTDGLVFGFRFWAAVPAAQLPAGQAQAQVTVQLI